MKEKKRNIVECAMHYRQIVILLTCCLMAFGVFGLANMKKNEFPDFTIRQGIVAAVCPGYTAEEVEEQVAKPLEDYIFSYKEVKKAKTHSTCKDGMVIIQVQLNDNLNNKDEFWSKFKHGINDFKGKLPAGVMGVQVMDDFGDTSALLVTMESDDKTYRELNNYMDNLKDRLRRIESVGRMSVSGMQQEQISVYWDSERLSHYGISERTLALTLFGKGFATTAGRVKDEQYVSPIYVSRSMNTLHDVQEMIVLSTPSGQTVRLKDVARVVKEYPVTDSYITNNGRKCLLLSVEMKKGKNIVQMGNAVKAELDSFAETLPEGIALFKITDQSQVVANSVSTFLHELLIAICAVILVVMLLLPIRVALVAASTIPISIFVSLCLFYVFGIELNTVTLGMIVDNSIVIIDSYLEMISEGMSRWHASIHSATHFFRSIFSATLAISITFFPFLFTMTGMTKDFLASFPWATTLILMISLLVAELLVPFMQFWFIRKPTEKNGQKRGKRAFSFLDLLQNGYNRLLDFCFAHPRIILGSAVVSVAIGIYMMGLLPQRLLPTAERNQFAVEIYMPTGTAVERTAQVADSLEHLLRTMPELNLVRTNFNEQLAATHITLDEDRSTRMGITNTEVEATLSMRYGSGMKVGTVWEGKYDIPVVMKSSHADSACITNVQDELLPVAGGAANVPLRQVAEVTTSWQNGQIVRRNGVRTITVMAETERGVNTIEVTAKVKQLMEENPVAHGVTVSYGGELEENDEQMPNIMAGLVIAIVIIFFILVFHFRRVNTATLMLACLSLRLFGTAIGVLVQGVDFGVTYVLGIVSLMGIIVRNGIIMIDYAEELRREEQMHVREAIYHSAKRRMRPIFLTSAAASMGVIPMILGGSGLWMPMGTVIFYGTLITMFFILTVIPVAYWKIMAGSTKRRMENEQMEKE